LTDRSDERLLSAYRKGDIEAFETLLHRYRIPLFNVVLRSVRDRGRAEEIYQDVWMRVIERAGDFRGDAKFSTWLYAIARNQCIDHQRKMKFRRHASLDATRDPDSASLADRLADGGPSTERLAAGRRMQERIAAAVETLPDDQREVFLLRQLQGMPFAEVAEIVGVSVPTAKSRMRYALERLQRALADWRRPNEL
jgi:RNA polymerase sigma-70 factor (ECF subfamily)